MICHQSPTSLSVVMMMSEDEQERQLRIVGILNDGRERAILAKMIVSLEWKGELDPELLPDPDPSINRARVEIQLEKIIDFIGLMRMQYDAPKSYWKYMAIVGRAAWEELAPPTARDGGSVLEMHSGLQVAWGPALKDWGVMILQDRGEK